MTRRAIMMLFLVAAAGCSSAKGVGKEDAGRDAGHDAGPPDAGEDAGIDAGFDAGCPEGSHNCPDGCHFDTDVNACGHSCAPCPAVANGTATCDGTSCGLVCDADAGAHLCGNECPLEGATSCGPSCTMCPAGPANTFPVCVGSQCTVACSGEFIECPNNPDQCGLLVGTATSACTSDSDCCSGQCQGTAQATQCCSLLGSPCQQLSDCSTYHCPSTNTQIEDGDMACGDAGTCCFPGGSTCTQDSDCCSNKCNNDVIGMYCD